MFLAVAAKCGPSEHILNPYKVLHQWVLSFKNFDNLSGNIHTFSLTAPIHQTSNLQFWPGSKLQLKDCSLLSGFLMNQMKCSLGVIVRRSLALHTD